MNNKTFYLKTAAERKAQLLTIALLEDALLKLENTLITLETDIKH